MARTRPVIYSVLPRELADELHDELRRSYEDQPNAEVIVDRRGAADRRLGRDAARSTIRERRVGDRRAAVFPATPLPLPGVADVHRGEIAFLQRLEPATLSLEDLDTARVVKQIQAGDGELFGILYARYFDRVYADLKISLQDRHEAEDAAQEVFIRVLEALPR